MLPWQDLKTLTELHIALSQAGQPHYLQHTYMYLLQDDLAGQINVIQAGLQQWRGFLAQLHSCNPVLLFLSVRQLHECVRCLAAAQTAGMHYSRPCDHMPSV